MDVRTVTVHLTMGRMVGADDPLTYAFYAAKEAWNQKYGDEAQMPVGCEVRQAYDDARQMESYTFIAYYPDERQELTSEPGDHASGVLPSKAGTEALVRPE